MFTFTSLVGAQSTCPANQSLLEFDGGVKVLIDVGWDDRFSTDTLRALDRQAPTISLILLTHPTLAHLGAYAHCCKHIPLFDRIPVYATVPVISFGRTLTEDLYSSTALASSTLPANALAEINGDTDQHSSDTHILLPRPSTEEIAGYFSHIHPLKYSQEHEPVSSSNAPPLEGLTITAYPAGHSVGGTIWHIRYGSESVVYAVDWSQARENITSGAAWLGGGATSGSEVIEQLRQPTALVCSSKRSQIVATSGGWRARDEHLLRHIQQTIQQGATVLIPCDSSARALELAFLLERAWVDHVELRNAKLSMATHQSDATMKYARSMLEWMDENVVKDFETQAAPRAAPGQASRGSQPFDFKYLKLIERKSQLDRVLTSSGAKVFLASSDTLDWGFSRDILSSMHEDSHSLVVIPFTPSSSDADARESRDLSLINMLAAKVDRENTIVQLNDDFEVMNTSVAALGLDETAVYQQYLSRQRQRQDASSLNASTTLETSTDAVDDNSSSSSSEDSDDEHQGRMLNTATTMQTSKRKFGVTDEELGINVLLRRKNAHDFDVRGKRGRERVFPFIAKRKRNDEFGDLIRPEDYLRAEERDDVDSQRPADLTEKENTQIGQKRRLDGRLGGGANGSGAQGAKGNKRRKSSTNERPATKREDAKAAAEQEEDEDESEESDYEPAEPQMLGPQKVTFTMDHMNIKTKLVAVDYSGIHDKRSLQNLLPLIKPRSLILTAGGSEETNLMKADCEQLLGSSASEGSGNTTGSIRIYAPLDGETVDASVDTNAWSIRLSRALVKTLHWQPFRQMGVATIDGQVGNMSLEDDGDASAAKRPKLESQSDDVKQEAQDDLKEAVEAVMPVLNELPIGAAAKSASFAQSVHVGDLRLAELRKLLQERGHTAEFKGEGTLLVDDYIAVRKSGIGKIEIESGGGYAALSSFGVGMGEVKQKIYEGLAVVAAR
ncbi:MAG: hypothetical protein Q9159_004711 [Coniocarpon cinnabarinum]